MTDLVDPTARTAGASPRGQAAQAPLVVPILMYHEIAANPLATGRLAVSPSSFAEQLSYLRAGGYTAMTAAEAVAAITTDAAELPPNPVVLTFDDGFADFHEAALPLLARYGFTATLFVTSGWVAQPGGLAGRAAPPGMLSWAQVGEIASAGIEIGAHSATHPQLDQLPAESLRRELTNSKCLLEDRLGGAVTGLAYPFGYSSRLVRATSASVGYDYGCAVSNRLASPGDDLFALPRLTIGRSTRLPGFARTVAAERLPAQFARQRMLTRGWSAVRHTRSAMSRIAR